MPFDALIETLVIGLGTYLLRAGSLSLGSRITWPVWLKNWLPFVTPAVLGALIGPLLFMPNGQTLSIWHNATLLAAVPTIITAWLSRHLLITVTVGIVSFAVITHSW